jgi:UDP-N-acetylglucosamine/UDP-N-acetylgalactosamine diphosphorylase
MPTPLTHDLALLDALLSKGVKVHAPASVVLCDLDPDRIEAGVELFPGVTLCGRRTLLRAGTRLGLAGGGYFEDIATGRDVTLYSGFFQDAVFLDGVTMRGHAEVRGGCLLEERCEAAHHVGFKMTIALPFCVAGSLINFCDVLISGGRSRSDHTEIGSTLALYNFTPWGDKFASMLGDVVHGVFLRSDRIFIGGQSQIISPIHVGFGATLSAGSPARHDIPAHTLYSASPLPPSATTLDARRYGALAHKLHHSALYIAQLRALHLWYDRVRLPLAASDPLQHALYLAAQRQILAGISERIARLDALIKRLPLSLSLHQAALAVASPADTPKIIGRVTEHARVIDDWSPIRALLHAPISTPDPLPTDDALAAFSLDALADQQQNPHFSYIDWITSPRVTPLIPDAQAQLQAVVDDIMGPVRAWLKVDTH